MKKRHHRVKQITPNSSRGFYSLQWRSSFAVVCIASIVGLIFRNYVYSQRFFAKLDQNVTVRPIARFDPAVLSVDAFRQQFLGIAPLVLETRNQSQIDVDMAMLAQLCPFLRLPVKRRDEHSWAGLKTVGTATLSELADTWASGDVSYYGFEGELACGCPAILDKLQVHVPPYFAGDILWENQVTKWPSLLIGPPSTGSALHIDKYGMPFWMLLLAGTKRVRIMVQQNESVLMGRIWDGLGNVINDSLLHKLGVFDNETEQLLSRQGIRIYDTTLRPGDVLYIPQFAAHAAVNVGDQVVVAVSANFVDYEHAILMRQHLESERGKCSADSDCAEHLNFLNSVIASGKSQFVSREDTNSWFSFRSQNSVFSNIPWCFAKLVHCLEHDGRNQRLLFDVCQADELLPSRQDTLVLTLARSSHLRSPGLANYVGALLMKMGKEHVHDALRLFRLAASHGHLMAQQNVDAIEEFLKKQ